jgi:hypothetical protein
MKRQQRSWFVFACVPVLLAAAGCSEQPGDRLVGQWAGAGQFEGTGTDPASEVLRAAMANYRLSAEFHQDRTYTRAVTVGGQDDPQPWSGSWRVVESQADRLVIELEVPNDGESGARRAEIDFLADGRAAYVEPGDEALPKFILSRVPER